MRNYFMPKSKNKKKVNLSAEKGPSASEVSTSNATTTGTQSNVQEVVDFNEMRDRLIAILLNTNADKSIEYYKKQISNLKKLYEDIILIKTNNRNADRASINEDEARCIRKIFFFNHVCYSCIYKITAAQDQVSEDCKKVLLDALGNFNELIKLEENLRNPFKLQLEDYGNWAKNKWRQTDNNANLSDESIFNSVIQLYEKMIMKVMEGQEIKKNKKLLLQTFSTMLHESKIDYLSLKSQGNFNINTLRHDVETELSRVQLQKKDILVELESINQELLTLEQERNNTNEQVKNGKQKLKENKSTLEDYQKELYNLKQETKDKKNINHDDLLDTRQKTSELTNKYNDKVKTFDQLNSKINNIEQKMDEINQKEEAGKKQIQAMHEQHHGLKVNFEELKNNKVRSQSNLEMSQGKITEKEQDLASLIQQTNALNLELQTVPDLAELTAKITQLQLSGDANLETYQSELQTLLETETSLAKEELALLKEEAALAEEEHRMTAILNVGQDSTYSYSFFNNPKITQFQAKDDKGKPKPINFNVAKK